ncbi:hypothetical protein TNCV_664751 [Trichonephila clavipes]|nr:hypothetical protein TNCV_664751 [Trichonephila clavipes]
MPENHSPDYNALASSLERSANGCRVFAFRSFPRIHQRSSVRWSLKCDSSENATCRHSVDVNCGTGVQISSLLCR